MPTFGLDLMMGRVLGFDDVRLEGGELVFSASEPVGVGCRAACEDGSAFVDIANLVHFPYECPRSTVGESFRGFRDSFEMLSILSPDHRPLEPVREDCDTVLSVARSVGPLFGVGKDGGSEIREPLSLWYWAATLFNYAIRLRDVEFGRARDIGLGLGLAEAFVVKDLDLEHESLVVFIPLRMPAGHNAVMRFIAPELIEYPFGEEYLPLDNVRQIDGSAVASWRVGRRGDAEHVPALGCIISALGGLRTGARIVSDAGREICYPCVNLPGGMVYQRMDGRIGCDTGVGDGDGLNLDQRVASELLQALVVFFTARSSLGWIPIEKNGGTGLKFAPTFTSAFEWLWYELGEWYPEDDLRRCPHCGKVFTTRGGRTKKYCSVECKDAEKSARQYRRSIGKELPWDLM